MRTASMSLHRRPEYDPQEKNEPSIVVRRQIDHMQSQVETLGQILVLWVMIFCSFGANLVA